ncbi:hypothetical protein CPC08DRAFT_703440 [Agrocybe pediades]|nr:hypothetical protein CPC08DRAFT_703440 [Agrocybe pediades]
MSNSPISKLSEEALWNLFLENTDICNASRLNTAIHCSQVCRQWRAIHLESPSIWGRLVELDYLQVANIEWVREILARTGNTRLWISGLISYSKDPVPSFLLSFLRDNWRRIQKLNIYDRGWNPLQACENRVQYWTTIFQQPAPSLEEFVFHYLPNVRDWEAPEVWRPPTPLFSGTVPALRRFEFFRIGRRTPSDSKFTMDMPSLWFSRLRSFTIRQGSDLVQLLEILGMMPLLEELEVHGPGGHLNHHQLEMSIPAVNLPRLTVIRLPDWPNQYLCMGAFLRCIYPSPRCCLIMARPKYDAFTTDKEALGKTTIVIAQYAERYLKHNPATKITLSRHNDYFSVQEGIASDPYDVAKIITSQMAVWIYDLEEDNSFAQMISDTAVVSSVVEIDFRCWEGAPLSSWSPAFSLSAFNSVTTLWLEETSFFPIWEWLNQVHGSVPLPQLRILKIGWQQSSLDDQFASWLYLFLKHRKEQGHPIAIIDFTNVASGKLDCNLDNLEEFTGLSVKWAAHEGGRIQVVEYKCGNGQPEQLRFKPLTRGRRTLGGLPPTKSLDDWYGWAGEI